MSLLFFYAASSALLLTLGFAPFSQAWAGWIALIPLALCIGRKNVSLWQTAWLGFFFGAAHFLSSLFWLTEVSWAGWIALSLYLALYPTLWTLFWRLCVSPRYDSLANILRALAGACAWTALEWLRGALFTGFPWNMLGVTQHSIIPLIQIADIGGVLLLSWLVVFVNLTFGLTLRRFWLEARAQEPRKAHVDFFLAVALVALAFTYGMHQLNHPPLAKTSLRYLAIQPSIPQDPWRQTPTVPTLTKLRQLTATALSLQTEPPQLILWPETPIAASVFEEPFFTATVRELMKGQPFALLLGSDDYTLTQSFNSAVLLQREGANAQVYHKNHLVIMGEYVPFTKIFPFLRKFVPSGTDFSAGEKTGLFEMAREGNVLRLAPLICFEDILPSLVRRAAQENPDLLVNLTNDGWFRHSAASRQHLHNALFRTIELRRPMLRVTNNGVTAAISAFGIPHPVFNENGDIHAAGFLTGNLPLPTAAPTIYQQWGDWIAYFSLLITIATLVFLFCYEKNIASCHSRERSESGIQKH
ncbi:MAG: apolipoprotein N-acyltransferase [bacterium]